MSLWLVLALGGAAGCRVREPVVHLHDVGLQRLGTDRIGLELAFEVYNPNVLDARLSSFSYTACVQDLELVSGTMEAPELTVPALERALLRLPASLDVGRAVEAARRAVHDEPMPATLTGRAVFHVLGVKVPVEFERRTHLSRPLPPRWDFQRLDLPDAAGEPMALVFDVTNPNAFALPLSALSGTISVAGRPVVELAQPGKEPLAPHQTRTMRFTFRVHLLEALRLAKQLGPNALPAVAAHFELDPPISIRTLAAPGLTQETP